MLKVAEVKEIYELKGAGHGIREIARELDISRNTVRRMPRNRFLTILPVPNGPTGYHKVRQFMGKY